MIIVRPQVIEVNKESKKNPKRKRLANKPSKELTSRKTKRRPSQLTKKFQ